MPFSYSIKFIAVASLAVGTFLTPSNSFGFQEKEAKKEETKTEQKKKETKKEPMVSFSINDGRMLLKAPKAWTKKKPRFAMIESEFQVKPADKKAEGARITIMKSGGSIDQNIARWKGQFEQDDDATTEEKTKVTKEKVQGMKVHFVEISGTFKSGGFGRPMKEKKDHRMVAAIVEGGSMGNYYFKMTGPNKLVKKNMKRFTSMVKGLKISL